MVEHEDELGSGGMASEDRRLWELRGREVQQQLTKRLDHVAGLLMSTGGGASGLGLGNLQAIG